MISEFSTRPLCSGKDSWDFRLSVFEPVCICRVPTGCRLWAGVSGLDGGNPEGGSQSSCPQRVSELLRRREPATPPCGEGTAGRKIHQNYHLWIRSWSFIFFFPSFFKALFKNSKMLLRTSLVIQGLSLWVPEAGSPGSIPGQRARSHTPLLKIPHTSVKIKIKDPVRHH